LTRPLNIDLPLASESVWAKLKRHFQSKNP